MVGTTALDRAFFDLAVMGTVPVIVGATNSRSTCSLVLKKQIPIGTVTQDFAFEGEANM